MRWLRARRQRATESRLAWILGSPRSGSTWLLQMLVDTGDVLPSDEPNIGVHLAPFTFERPGMHAADFSDENSTLYRFGRGQRGYFFSDHHEPAWREPLRELICARYCVRRRDHLDSGEQELLAEIMGPTLRESGYEA